MVVSSCQRIAYSRMADSNIKNALKDVLRRMEEASNRRIPELQCVKPQLVAVSKTKPARSIVECYEAGQRHFGENYVQELAEKSNDAEVLEKCKDVRWHFIGRLQTNKINKVLSSPNLYVVETVDSVKLAGNLNKSWPKFGPPSSKLKVMVQVNTSGEEEKNGVEPSAVVDVAKYVVEECENLELDGLMTIGRFGYNAEDGPNPDFVCLKKCRDDVCRSLGIDWNKLQLSMGMSDDFEHAIEMGSTSIRVGSSIFGSRTKAT